MKTISQSRLGKFILECMKTESPTKATCIACERTYWATEAYVRNVQLGKVESLCGHCDGSHMEVESEERSND